MYSFITIDSYYFSAHSRRNENKNDDSYSHRNTLVDCWENIKVEPIKEEFNDKDIMRLLVIDIVLLGIVVKP